MNYPFRDKADLKTVEPGVIRVINANKNTVESFSELADEAFNYFRSNITTSWDSYLQQKSDDINSELLGRDSNKEEQLNNFIKDDSVSKHTFTSPETITVLSDNDVGEKIRSLNLKQKELFDKERYLTLSIIGKNYIPFLNLLLKASTSTIPLIPLVW